MNWRKPWEILWHMSLELTFKLIACWIWIGSVKQKTIVFMWHLCIGTLWKWALLTSFPRNVHCGLTSEMLIKVKVAVWWLRGSRLLVAFIDHVLYYFNTSSLIFELKSSFQGWGVQNYLFVDDEGEIKFKKKCTSPPVFKHWWLSELVYWSGYGRKIRVLVSVCGILMLDLNGYS